MAQKITREPPRRTMRKQEAVKHLLHSAIRLIAAREDPFAIHLLIQSADKLLIDLAKHAKKPLNLNWGESFRPEYQKQFMEIFRETSNFLKHADKDHDAELHVGNIVGFNVMMLAVSTANYFRLFDEFTDHMRAFQSLAKLTYPSSFVTEEQRPAFDASLPAFEHMTPTDFFDAMLRGEYAIVLPNIQAEKVQDLVDNQLFYTTPFAVHRQGP
jgi:hypothetical protein